MKRHKLPSLVVLLLLLASPGVGLGQIHDKVEYFGACDASAATALGPQMFVMASDEDNLLRIYSGEQPTPLCTLDLSSFLGSEKEADIEACAVSEGLIYWITSHGTNSEGEERPARRKLFATKIEVHDNELRLALVGTPYTHLVEDMIASTALQQFGISTAQKTPPKEKGGLNIEGLAANGNELLIGFRNPIPKKKALIVPLKNPGALIQADASRAEFGTPLQLDLGGRGIRSIDYAEASQAFFIVAGRYDEKRDFRLYRWKGPGHKPESLDIDFGKLMPEALVVYPDPKDRLQVLSDDGTRSIEYHGKEKECKSLPVEERRFRAGWVHIP